MVEIFISSNFNFSSPSLKHIIGYIHAGTGFNYDTKSLILVGEIINNIKRLFNCNLGITRRDKKCGWDWETGKPTEEKLKQLGLFLIN